MLFPLNAVTFTDSLLQISFSYFTSGLSELIRERRAITDCKSHILLSILCHISTGERLISCCMPGLSFLSGEQMPTSQHDPGPTGFGVIFWHFKNFNSVSVICVGGLTQPSYFAAHFLGSSNGASNNWRTKVSNRALSKPLPFQMLAFPPSPTSPWMLLFPAYPSILS